MTILNPSFIEKIGQYTFKRSKLKKGTFYEDSQLEIICDWPFNDCELKLVESAFILWQKCLIYFIIYLIKKKYLALNLQHWFIKYR